MKRLLPLLLLFASSTILAESGSYRVEVIVFRNLLVETGLSEAPELRSFSQFPDLVETGRAEKLPADPAHGSNVHSAAELSNVLHSALPDDLHIVTQKSSEMDNAWRRLRSSQGYQPLVYTAWEQNRTDYYPPIRIHDQQVIDTQLRAPTQIMLADLTAQDPLAAYRSTFYQLDGSLQLRRSRFLHLFMDLEFRVERPQNDNDAEFLTGNTIQINTVKATDEPDAHAFFFLKQNRQISTNQMQYFDTPYFGALVYVTSIPSNQAPP